MLSARVSATLTERIRLLGFRLLSHNRSPPRSARRQTIAAEALEPRIVLATILAGTPFSFSDADGDQVTAKLKGPGSVDLTLNDPDQDGNGSIASLVLTNTTAKSKLSIVVKPNNNGGDGKVSIGNVTGPALGALKVRGDMGGEWELASVGSISVTGGDFDAEVFLTASPADLGKRPALGTLKISGGDFTGSIGAVANLGTIDVRKSKTGGGNVIGGLIAGANLKAFAASGDVQSSIILAGVNLGANLAIDETDDFGPGTIGKFAVGGNVTSSVLGAGLFTNDTAFNDDDDALIGGTAAFIKSFLVKGTASNDSFFAAGVFPKKVKIGGSNVTPAADARFLTLGSPDLRAPVFSAALVQDTGASALDGITLNADVSGRVTDNLGAPKLSAAFGTPSAAALRWWRMASRVCRS